jgi:hypothetical protein
MGCGSDPASDRLLVTIDNVGPVQVDSACGQICGGADQTAVALEYPDQQYRADEIVQVLQYRVDYRLPNLRVPYFAGTVGAVIAPGDRASLLVTVAGTAQREDVFEAVGGDPVSGTATITFAGYDWDNGQFTTGAEFDVRFSDLVDVASAGTGAGVDDGAGDGAEEAAPDGGIDASAE